MLTEQENLNLQEAIEAAQACEAETGLWASLTVAQWALESEWGQHSPGNNPFGITYSPATSTAKQLIWTHEEVRPAELKGWELNHPELQVVSTLDNGNLRIKVQREFAAYPTLEAAFKDHARLLTQGNRYYHFWVMTKNDPTPDRFIDLFSTTYATDTSYAGKLKGIISEHNLGRFDRSQTPQEVTVVG